MKIVIAPCFNNFFFSGVFVFHETDGTTWGFSYTAHFLSFVNIHAVDVYKLAFFVSIQAFSVLVIVRITGLMTRFFNEQ